MKNKLMRTLAMAIAAAALATGVLAGSASACEIFEEVPEIGMEAEQSAFREETSCAAEDVFSSAFEEAAFEEETNVSIEEAGVFEEVFEAVDSCEEEAAASVSGLRMAYVNNENLSIKPDMTVTSKAIGVAVKGSYVTVLKDGKETGTNRWYLISANGVTGYVSGWGNNLIMTGNAPASVTETITITNVNKYMNVSNPLGLNLFEQPSLDSRVIDNARYGSQVYVYGAVVRNGAYTDLVKVSYNGKIGYMVNHVVDIPAPAAATGVYQTYVKAGALALRSSAATTNANQIGFLPNGSTVRVIGNNVNGFVYVTVVNGPASTYGSATTGMSGYVNASYLRAA